MAKQGVSNSSTLPEILSWTAPPHFLFPSPYIPIHKYLRSSETQRPREQKTPWPVGIYSRGLGHK